MAVLFVPLETLVECRETNVQEMVGRFMAEVRSKIYESVDIRMEKEGALRGTYQRIQGTGGKIQSSKRRKQEQRKWKEKV